MTGHREFRLRRVEAEDSARELARLIDFYEEHRHSNNSLRSPERLLAAIERRAVFVIEDETAALRAAAGTFFHSDNYAECGGTRVLDEGFGLQRVLIHCRALQAFLFDPPGRAFFTAIKASAGPSLHNAQRCGFEPWQPEEHFYQDTGLDRAKLEAQQLRFFRFDPGRAAMVAGQILALDSQPLVTHRTDPDRHLRLTLDLALLRRPDLRGGLQQLAERRQTLAFTN